MREQKHKWIAVRPETHKAIREIAFRNNSTLLGIVEAMFFDWKSKSKDEQRELVSASVERRAARRGVKSAANAA